MDTSGAFGIAGSLGLFFDYTLTGTSTRPNKGNNNNTLTGYGQAGLNLGEWRLRAEYQGNYSSEYSSNNRFDWNQIYAYKPLPDLCSQTNGWGNLFKLSNF